MRTTLTIDDDIAVLVQQEVRRTGDSFKGTVNRLLRQGIVASKSKTARKPIEIVPFNMGLMPGLNYDSIPELLDATEKPFPL